MKEYKLKCPRCEHVHYKDRDEYQYGSKNWCKCNNRVKNARKHY